MEHESIKILQVVLKYFQHSQSKQDKTAHFIELNSQD